MRVCRTCTVCGKDSSVEVTDEQGAALAAGGLVQNVCAEMSVDLREQIATGTHGPCFDSLFAGGEE